jgi:transposase
MQPYSPDLNPIEKPLGAVVFRKKLRRDRVLKFLAGQPACTVAMEACASSHYWGREIAKLGHVVRLIAPDYVKPFVKRQKNDAADAEAICEATQRPTMRFVTVKGEEQQAAAVVFRARDLLVRQRTQIINAIRGHLAEFGMVVAKGPFHVAKLVAAIEDNHAGIPAMARPVLRLLVDQLRSLDERVVVLDRELARRAREDEDAKRRRGPFRRPDLFAQLSASEEPRFRTASVARSLSLICNLRLVAGARQPFGSELELSFC